MKLFRTLPLIAAMSLAFSGTVRGQSLVDMYDAARDFDATFKGDRPVSVPSWCAFAHGLSLNPLDRE